MTAQQPGVGPPTHRAHDPQPLQEPVETFRVAVLMAAHNRRDLTIGTLRRVHDIAPSHWRIRVYLTDDNSTDGTAAAVSALPIDVTIVRGSGEWFWSRSMAEAEAAIDQPYDALLWLNDDIDLQPDALAIVDDYHRRFPDCLLVGQFRDPDSCELSYGGRRLTGRYPLANTHVLATDAPVPVDLIAGNLLLVPARAAAATGPIDGSFSHGYADYDYGLRARGAGYPALAIPGYVGTARTNPAAPAADLRQALRFHSSRFGFPPRDRAHYLRRHGGRAWWAFLPVPYVAALLGHRPMVRTPNPGSSAAADTAGPSLDG